MVPTQPPLGPGRHLLTHRVASFMEAASQQAGQRWSDSPSCTDELIATLARGVNNALSSDTRPRLAALVPLVIGLHADDPRWHSWVVMHVASTTVPVAPESQQRSLAVAILSAARSLRSFAPLGLADGGPPRDREGLTLGARQAFAAVPLARAWAEGFANAHLGLVKHEGPHPYNMLAGKAVMNAAVYALVNGSNDDRDGLLIDLLTSTVLAARTWSGMPEDDTDVVTFDW